MDATDRRIFDSSLRLLREGQTSALSSSPSSLLSLPPPLTCLQALEMFQERVEGNEPDLDVANVRGGRAEENETDCVRKGGPCHGQHTQH
eukprot:276145-Hanusia_phi.AAC.6